MEEEGACLHLLSAYPVPAPDLRGHTFLEQPSEVGGPIAQNKKIELGKVS